MRVRKLNLMLIASLLLVACGKDGAIDQSVSGAFKDQTLPIIGGSVTKEIIVRTNLENSSPAQSVRASYQVTSKPRQLSPTKHLEIAKKIEETRNNEVKKYRDSDPLIKADYSIDLANTAIIAIASTTLTPAVGIGAGMATTFGASALKGYLEDKRESELESLITTLSNRRDRDLLQLSLSIAQEDGETVLESVHAGLAPEVIKENIFKYRNEIAKKSELPVSDIEKMIDSSNDGIMLGLLLASNKNEISLSKDIRKNSKALKESTTLLQESVKNTEQLLLRQSELAELLNSRFSPSENDLIVNALFDPSVRSTKSVLLNPSELKFFKEHPGKLKLYRDYLMNDSKKTKDLMAIVAIEESAQKSLAYLQVTTQIFTNFNMSGGVVEAMSKGIAISSTISSMASFAVTSNPLDALNAVASISGMFAKKKSKPDPRFTALFNNLDMIHQAINRIENQISSLHKRFDNVDEGLSYIIKQNEAIADLLLDYVSNGYKQCSLITSELEKVGPLKLNHSYFVKNFRDTTQGDDQKIDLCMDYLLNAFESDPANNSLFLEKYAPERINRDPKFEKYFTIINQQESIYKRLKPFMTSSTRDDEFKHFDMFLSVPKVIEHTKRLINNSFLFDIAQMDQQRRTWRIVDRGILATTIKNNKKSQTLLENAIELIEKAIIQQSTIDGVRLERSAMLKFLEAKDVDCSKINFEEISCLAILNPTLMNNMLRDVFIEYVGYNYYWSWNQIASSNPDWINKKLNQTPIRIVWVGNGASNLFTGLRLPIGYQSLSDGAYLKIAGRAELLNLPSVEMIHPTGRAVISERVRVLSQYKTILENELIERNIEKILAPDELNDFNKNKINTIL